MKAARVGGFAGAGGTGYYLAIRHGEGDEGRDGEEIERICVIRAVVDRRDNVEVSQ